MNLKKTNHEKKILLILSVLFFISCVDDDSFPKTENITSGRKWTLQIGSSPIEVYSQLQQLGVEKKFYAVGIAYRKPFANPKEIQSDLSLYSAITLEAPSYIIQRVAIRFDQDKVKEIEKGGGLLDSIAKWPENTPDESTIHLNDPIDGIRQKLLAIYQNSAYKNYTITLSDKWLKKPFDPDMANYNEWHFAFTTDISSSRSGSSSVTLFFKNAKLCKIQHHYREGDIVN